ncbi:hypothetical protein C7H19_01905 [Aphanothece hegewaldii CCALA 016]|uniref:Uncharacterized protein n=1 Tax=Aphanothece hegewaldii CCALA 016 TaxID=2107694 RepID=A0A2T1M422_9CHRO|nr:hypothetical protein [Aphanothece hegewaldii]PSF39568.1 hypothetical protein C7H19_01905 [Aphanothece hegewaldii CCALA 016]
MRHQLLKKITLLTGTLALVMGNLIYSVTAQQHHHGHSTPQIDTSDSKTLPPVPTDLPSWMNNKSKNHIYRKRGVYNDAVYNIKPLALDLNAVAVGHAFAYEDLVTGKEKELETKTFDRINWILKNPPRFMPDEANISPTFGRKYGVLEQVFDWAHILHAQTVDVLVSSKMTEAEKEAEIERLYEFYVKNVPYAITGLPMNMGYLDTQPYSKAFRQEYKKVNGLFWGYHWLQGSMYDMLYGKTLEEQKNSYATVGKQYHEIELYRTDRPFMPMFAEVSPRFAQRFPKIANTFDNLHMLHDMVNDILASDWITEQQKEEQIQRAIWLVMAKNHEGMEAGQNSGGEGLHDHRFMAGMPGMGLMPEGIGHQGHDKSETQTNPNINHDGHSMPNMNHDDNSMPNMNHDGHSMPNMNHDGHSTPNMNHDNSRPGMTHPTPQQTQQPSKPARSNQKK